jgi:acyl carrier protein phosphodiesterase
LNTNYDLLTPKTQQFMPYMIAQNWLLSYQTIEGIESILTQMDARMKKRMKQESNMRFSVTELRLYYTKFEAEFTAFFNELIAHSKHKLNYNE